MNSNLTGYIDVAQVVLYLFWVFFFGLVYWLRKEDRREGYPLENDKTGLLLPNSTLTIPPPKTFKLPHGGEVQQPNFKRDTREILAERFTEGSGAYLEPKGDPMLSNTGPASYAERADVPEPAREGKDLIAPMRALEGFAVDAGPDPRGWKVIAADGKQAGVVKELWVDRADIMVRYVEVELSGGSTRLVPMTMLRVKTDPDFVEVLSIKSHHFANVPTLKNPDRVTLLEEEKITAYYAAGRLYADPSRLGPLV